MTFSIIRLGKLIATVTLDAAEWFGNPLAIREVERVLRDGRVAYDRIEPWNPCKIFRTNTELHLVEERI